MTDKILDENKDNHKNEEERNDIEEFSSTVDPRAEQMARMVDNATTLRDESREEFIKENGFNPDGHAEPEEIIEEIEPEPVDKPEPTGNTPIIERDGNQFIQLRVDGKDIEMPVGAAVGALQKNDNADQKLWEAAQTKKRYDDLIAQHEETATLPDASDDNAVDTQEALKDALTKVYDGDVEEAAEVLGRVLRPQTQAVQPVDVAAQVAETVAKLDDHKNLKTAYDNFMDNDDFKNITTDPVLLERVNTFTEALQRDPEFMATKPTYADFFKEAGTRTQDWVDSISGTTKEQAPQNDVDSRLERKRTTPSKPQTRTVRRGPKVTEPSYDSRESIIAKMAQRRGQTNL